MKKIGMFFVMMLVIVSVVFAQQYTIELTTTPEKIVARDNPFAHYNDLGALPQLTVTVTDSAGNPMQDVTIQMTITHNDNLILPSGFPWVQGKELLSITSYEEDAVLTIDGLLFPLRGEYIVQVNVIDTIGQTQSLSTTLHAAEPFKQSTLNGLFFVSALLVFGIVVGLVFGKDIFMKKKAQGKVFSALLITAMLILPFAVAHTAEEIDTTGVVHYEDEQVTFYTNPQVPDIGTPTTFFLEVKDENGIPVNNAVAHIEFANEEEGFVVLETIISSQTGMFVWNYGIFDGAPHIATIRVEPTAMSSVAFASIEREYAFSGEAHNPPLGAKAIVIIVMLATLLIGFFIGAGMPKLSQKE